MSEAILNLFAHPTFDRLEACPGGWKIAYSSKVNDFAPGVLFDGTLDKLLDKYAEFVATLEA